MDGQDLMNRAFSVNTPILKLNRLRTRSEKDEQLPRHMIVEPGPGDALGELTATSGKSTAPFSSLSFRRCHGAVRECVKL